MGLRCSVCLSLLSATASGGLPRSCGGDERSLTLTIVKGLPMSIVKVVGFERMTVEVESKFVSCRGRELELCVMLSEKQRQSVMTDSLAQLR